MVLSPHGGDIYSAEERTGGSVLDFSANINPLGLPEGVRAAAAAALLECEHYPDPYCRKLVAAIAQAERVPGRWIQCGNGAADLIYRMAYAVRPRHALILAPTFSEYEQALTAAGAQVKQHLLASETEFQLQPDILDAITPEVEMVCLCNPNNPTGQLADPELLTQVVRHCQKLGIYLLIDECFNDFLEHPEHHTQKPLLKECGRLVILKAFTKRYAMAGFRLGYCLCSDEDLLDRMARCTQAWSVSSLAQAAGVQALQETEYNRRTDAFFAAERPRMHRALGELGLKVIGSHANYLFFRAEQTNLAVRLEERGILIRRCDNFSGLDSHYYRAAIRTEGENNLLLQALEEILWQE